MSNEFHQIRQVELTTNQLLLAQACVDAARIETVDYINKVKAKDTEDFPGQLESATRDLDDLKILSSAFRAAMMDIESTWGKEQ